MESAHCCTCSASLNLKLCCILIHRSIEAVILGNKIEAEAAHEYKLRSLVNFQCVLDVQMVYIINVSYPSLSTILYNISDYMYVCMYGLTVSLTES